MKDLNIYEYDFWGQRKVQTKVRHYVDKLSEILEKDDHIFKGEDDGHSLENFSNEYIASSLRDKIYDSSITIILISKGMKNIFQTERDQWIPWEISFSLRESTRNGRTSNSNGILAVVLPDEWGSYEYYMKYDAICNCQSLNTPFLFKILKNNMFNEKHPTTSECVNGSIVYHGDSCYIPSVNWDEFINNPTNHINKSIIINGKKDNYVVKSVD